MSSLSGQQYNSKNMTGLSDTYSTNINCDTITVANNLTCSTGCVISLPNASIQDSYLSANVAFRNQANTFTQSNIFSNAVTFSSTTTPVITQPVSATPSTNIPTTSWVNTYYGKLTLATSTTTQIWFGDNRFTTSGLTLPIVIQNTDVPTYFGGMFIPSGSGQYNANNQVGDLCLLSTGTSASNTGALSLCTWSSTNCGIRITNNTINVTGGVTLTTTATTHNNTATNYNNSGICSFTNTTTPVITQTILTADNSTKIVTSAWVRLQNYITSSALSGYALLAGPQTFTGNQNFPTQATSDNSTLCATTEFVKNQGYITGTGYALLAPSSTQTFAGTASTNFTNSSIFSAGLQSNNNITLFSIGGGGQTTNIQQNNSGLTITNVDVSKYIQLITRDSGGANVIGVSCANGNSAYIQGDSGAQISITGTQANIGGTSVPTVTTQPLSASNTNEIATTAWSKTQLSGYASLNLNNTFNGNNNFTKRVDFQDVSPNYAMVIKNSVSTSSGGLIIPATTGAYNNINIANDFCVIGSGATIDTGNLTLSTWSAGYCGIRITNNSITYNAPFTCGYLTIPTPITTKSNYQIGYIWSIPGTSFTSWSGFTSVGNVYTLPWNGTGDATLGVWRADICLATATATSMDSGMCLNTVSATNFTINTRSIWEGDLASFGTQLSQVLRMSFTMEITNLTTTYYLNFKLNNGSSRSDLTAGSQMLFTRIA